MARGPRGPARAAAEPPHPVPSRAAPPGARGCCSLPGAASRGSASRTTPAPAEPPPLGDGVSGTESSRRPRGTGRSAAQPCAPAEPCAPRAIPVPSKAVTKRSLPARCHAWRGPERRRHDPGGCPRKSRRPPAAPLLLARRGTGRLRSPPGKGPGRQRSASSPRARLCAQREKRLHSIKQAEIHGRPGLLDGNSFKGPGWAGRSGRPGCTGRGFGFWGACVLGFFFYVQPQRLRPTLLQSLSTRFFFFFFEGRVSTFV